MTVAAPDRATAAADAAGSTAPPGAGPQDSSAAGGEPGSPRAGSGEQHQHHHGRGSKHGGTERRRKKRHVFGVTLLAGGVLALAIALALPKAAQDERVRAAVNDGMQRLNNTLVEHLDVSLDGFLERLSNLSDTVSSLIGDDGPRPGQLAAAKGLRAHHPVVVIPGFVTSGLELWRGEPCAHSFFRQRLWGTLSMAQTLLADRACWLRHMKLDPVTGADPPGIKLRAAKALEAVDYFVPGYWVFSKLLQSLADLGYDNNNLVAVPYDWRLPMPVMQQRDGYFTRLKNEVELQAQLSRGVKPVLISHSYGALVTMAFMRWVEQQQPGWVDRHVAAYINLGGPLLGLPKALSPLLSGETRETVDMMAGLAVLVEQYLGKQARAQLFRTWGSVLAMLPVGGPGVWGNATSAPDDDERIKAAGRSFGGIVAVVRSADDELRDAVRRNDSSLVSSDKLSLLTTTLSNWGAAVKNLSNAIMNDDDDDDGGEGGQGGEEGGGGGGAAPPRDGREEEQAEEREAEKEGAPAAEAAAAAGDGKQVRLLDVPAALTSLALTAGGHVTRNMQRWSAAGRRLDLGPVLEHHRRAVRQLRARLQGGCEVDPSKDGAEYAGQCSGGGGGGGGGAQGGVAPAAEPDEEERATAAAEDADGSDAVLPVDPVSTPLPAAPGLRLYCLYGVGSPTERGYHYLKTRKAGATEWSVNNMANHPASGLESGVQLSDGDGTVPLLSLGALCAGGWRTRRLNPSGLPVVIREYPNNPGPAIRDARGGPGASTHVEILGNHPMLLDLMSIVAGKGAQLGDKLHTDVRGIAGRIPWDDL